MKGILGVVVASALLLVVVTQARATNIVLPRSGQVGIGVQGQFGSLMKSGRLGREFGSGGNLAIRLKYRMRYERAMGLTFEQIKLDSRAPSSDSTLAFATPDPDHPTQDPREWMQATTEGFEMYQFFGTRTKMPRYIGAGVGLAQISAHLQDGGTQYPYFPDAYYVSACGGLERFVFRSWAIDLTGRYMGILQDGSMNHHVHVALGMIFYAAY